MQQIHRHGDVILKPGESIPSEAKLVKESKSHVLAYGSVTGHSHLMTGPKIKVYELDGKVYLDIAKPAELNHEEHGHQDIEAGIYQVIIKTEYDYFAKKLSQVKD